MDFEIISFATGICFWHFCQEIGRFITETRLRIKDRQIEHMLELEEKEEDFPMKRIQVTDNKCKLDDYKEQFKKICKYSEDDEVTLSPDEIKYAFAYCIYYIENRGKNQKVEKMRALYGMAQNLIGSGIMIIISGTLILFYLGQMPSEKVIICSLVAAIIFVLVGVTRVDCI